MMIVITVILLIVGFIAIFMIANKSTSRLRSFAILWALFLSIGGVVLNDLLNYKYPQAIDVYRNNTELVVTTTVKNDTIIECDTTVIFKKAK